MTRLPLEVRLTEYRLDTGHVGEDTGRVIVWSRHRSLRAAGRALGSVIMNRKVTAPRGTAYRYLVHNVDTGETFTRNACKV
jgi:hypothetical protein